MDRTETIAKLVHASPMLAAVGEELSFTRAAERLSVDQSAVSHRIKSLEGALGHTLFDRTTRALRLTEIGEILCHAAIDAMANWDSALDRLERSRSTNQIHLSLPSSLAMKWLIPALPRAHATGLDVSVDVKEETVDFQANEADAAIRFGRGPYPGLHSSHLCHCRIQPVVSSTYSGDRDLFSDSETIYLADRGGEIDGTDFSWNYYLDTSGFMEGDFEPDHLFDRADLMLQAVIAGMGVGLGRTLLVEADIEAGYLSVAGPSLRLRSGYWLVCSPGFAETRRHERLRDWLKSEIESTTAKTPDDTF